jgi:hypothetical protein
MPIGSSHRTLRFRSCRRQAPTWRAAEMRPFFVQRRQLRRPTAVPAAGSTFPSRSSRYACWMSSSLEIRSTRSQFDAHFANGAHASANFCSSSPAPQSEPRFLIRSGANKKTGFGPIEVACALGHRSPVSHADRGAVSETVVVVGMHIAADRTVAGADHRPAASAARIQRPFHLSPGRIPVCGCNAVLRPGSIVFARKASGSSRSTCSDATIACALSLWARGARASMRKHES